MSTQPFAGRSQAGRDLRSSPLVTCDFPSKSVFPCSVRPPPKYTEYPAFLDRVLDRGCCAENQISTHDYARAALVITGFWIMKTTASGVGRLAQIAVSPFVRTCSRFVSIHPLLRPLFQSVPTSVVFGAWCGWGCPHPYREATNRVLLLRHDHDAKERSFLDPARSTRSLSRDPHSR